MNHCYHHADRLHNSNEIAYESCPSRLREVAASMNADTNRSCTRYSQIWCLCRLNHSAFVIEFGSTQPMLFHENEAEDKWHLCMLFLFFVRCNEIRTTNTIEKKSLFQQRRASRICLLEDFDRACSWVRQCKKSSVSDKITLESERKKGQGERRSVRRWT